MNVATSSAAASSSSAAAPPVPVEVDKPDREIKAPEVKRAPRPKAAPVQAPPITEEDDTPLPEDFDKEIAEMEAEIALRKSCTVEPPLTAAQLKELQEPESASSGESLETVLPTLLSSVKIEE